MKQRVKHIQPRDRFEIFLLGWVVFVIIPALALSIIALILSVISLILYFIG